MSENRGNRREVVGVVISDKMDKTITVRIAYTAQHPVFKKTIKKFTKFKAHD
ncbi:MAG: 30S ribosomal protein S17, partial [Candidatus Omnitrophota bacterium]